MACYWSIATHTLYKQDLYGEIIEINYFDNQSIYWRMKKNLHCKISLSATVTRCCRFHTILTSASVAVATSNYLYYPYLLGVLHHHSCIQGRATQIPYNAHFSFCSCGNKQLPILSLSYRCSASSQPHTGQSFFQLLYLDLVVIEIFQ